MKAFCLAFLLFASSAGVAEVIQVNIWNPLAGKGPLTFQYGREARSIHEALGGNVLVAADLEGRMHYALTFANWAEWAAFGKKLEDSEEWSVFLSKTNAAPSAELEDQYMLDVPSPVQAGAVYQVFIWEPELGRGNDLVNRAMQAEAIHEKAGARVGINVDQLGRLHYLMSFDSWDAWAKFQDTPNEEFQKFMAEQSNDPAGRLIKVYTAERQ